MAKRKSDVQLRPEDFDKESDDEPEPVKLPPSRMPVAPPEELGKFA